MTSMPWKLVFYFLSLSVVLLARENCEQDFSMVVRGTAQLRRAVRITKTTSQQLTDAQRQAEKIPDDKLEALIALGENKLREKQDVAAVANNLEHVETQHLKPLEADAADLARAFGIQPKTLRLLMVLHDLGKVEVPAELAAALKAAFPNDPLARSILTHEYASMLWIDKFGKQAGLSPKEILALQRLIANHNFGPDLSRPGTEGLAKDWWPTNFRERVIPTLAKLGIRVDEVFPRSPDGKLQYNHTEASVYPSLLSAYDRALANKYNTYGVASWQKFAQGDHNFWKDMEKLKPGTPTPFSGMGLVKRMEQSATNAKAAVESTWKILAERHATEPGFDLKTFAPYRNQIEGIENLQRIIGQVARDNPSEIRGQADFTDKLGQKFRVVEGAQESELSKWNASTAEWEVIAKDASPVKLFFEVVRRG